MLGALTANYIVGCTTMVAIMKKELPRFFVLFAEQGTTPWMKYKAKSRD
jgi:hypothetical protein